MSDTITLTSDDARVVTVLDRIAAGVDEPAALLGKIGQDLVESTKQRFVTGTAPDGTRWAPNTQATFEAYLHRISGAYSKEGERTGTRRGFANKDGRLGAKGVAAVMGKRPLVGEGRALSTQIYDEVSGVVLFVGSPEVYAAMQQFGGSKAEFPNLWGDIVARPFLGVSDSDAVAIEQTAEDYLASLLSE